MRRAAADGSVQVLPNLEREQLLDLYGEAKIFWHAGGLGEDEEARPEWREHFGIVTVEAMAASCVPIGIRKGGQPEIGEHGVSGFLWDTLGELKEYTRLLARDEALRARLATAARARAPRFSRAAYVDGMLALLGPLLAGALGASAYPPSPLTTSLIFSASPSLGSSWAARLSVETASCFFPRRA